MDSLLELAIWIGLAFVVLLIIFIVLTSLYRRASKGNRLRSHRCGWREGRHERWSAGSAGLP